MGLSTKLEDQYGLHYCNHFQYPVSYYQPTLYLGQSNVLYSLKDQEHSIILDGRYLISFA